MIRRLTAVARLTLKEAIRSRVLLALLALLAAVVFGLPPLLRGDGTPGGLSRMILGYTLGAAFGVLALATLWVSCALVSGEVAAHTLPLALVKPAPAWQIWLGKLLGVLLLDALLLAGVAAAVHVTVIARLRQHPEAAIALRLARAAYAPELPSLDRQLELAMSGLDLSLNDTERQQYRRRLRRELPFQPAALARGGTWSWRFRLDRPPDQRFPIWLRLRFDTDAFTRAVVKAQCRLSAPGNGAGFDFNLDDFSSREFEVRLPSAPFAGQRLLELTMRHTGDEQTGPLLLQPRQGLTLLLPRGSLAGNLLRAAALQLSLLALLASLGLALGSFFSLPVASFCATGLLVATLVSAFVMNDRDAEEVFSDAVPSAASRWLHAAALGTTAALDTAARPALAPEPLRRLAAAELFPADELGRSWLVNGLIAPCVCGALAAAALKRREFPN
ncbi:MAG: hypothetical protein PHR35_21395 [Kiritimatiellae bacterium]|nr:hypothetical protein [Kiritimatiellia bacterium]